MEHRQVKELVKAASDHVVSAGGMRLSTVHLRDALTYPATLEGDDMRIFIHPMVIVDFLSVYSRYGEMLKYRGVEFSEVEWMPFDKVIIAPLGDDGPVLSDPDRMRLIRDLDPSVVFS